MVVACSHSHEVGEVYPCGVEEDVDEEVEVAPAVLATTIAAVCCVEHRLLWHILIHCC